MSPAETQSSSAHARSRLRQTGLTFGPGLFKAGRLWSESGLGDEEFRLSAACVCACLRVCVGRRGVVFASVGCRAKPEVCCGCFLPLHSRVTDETSMSH